MKRHSLLTGLLLLAAATAAPAGEQFMTVAVFNFDTPDDTVRDLGPKIATLINATLSAEPQIITVERAELEKVLGEQELGLSGTVSADTAAKVGHLTGAKVLVTGRAFKVDRELVLVAKIISAETSRVYGEVVKDGADGAIADLASALARKITRTLAEKGDTLVVKAESREERIARLIRSLKEGKRPAVSVTITERHFGQPSGDPAAATELMVVLQRAGFTVVDEQSKQKAEIAVTGEAFSAAGSRKGNLVSCKARVELKAHDLRSRKLVLADRQTSVAVDVTEQTAGKSALQNAALELAERLLPKLAN